MFCLTIMHSFFILALISVQWVLFGYSLAFGPDYKGIIGDLSWIGLNGVGLEPNTNYAGTVPHMVFMAFQMMFAVNYSGAYYWSIRGEKKV